jgi:hypothetical protein
MAAPVFRSIPDPAASVDPQTVRPTNSPAGDILDLIDGAVRDYELSADAMRWAPDGEATNDIIRVQLHTSSPWAGACDPEVGDPRSAVRTEPASRYASGGTIQGGSPVYTWFDETQSWPHFRLAGSPAIDILAHAAEWYGPEVLRRWHGVVQSTAGVMAGFVEALEDAGFSVAIVNMTTAMRRQRMARLHSAYRARKGRRW